MGKRVGMEVSLAIAEAAKMADVDVSSGISHHSSDAYRRKNGGTGRQR